MVVLYKWCQTCNDVMTKWRNDVLENGCSGQRNSIYKYIYLYILFLWRIFAQVRSWKRHFVISSLTPTSIPIICYAANGVGLGGRKGRVWDSVIRIFFIHDIHSLSIATIHLLHGGVQLANVVMTKWRNDEMTFSLFHFVPFSQMRFICKGYS